MKYILPYEKLDNLFKILQDDYRLLGPQVVNSTILYQDLADSKQLPWGWVDDQQLGSYKLRHTENRQVFGWVNGPQGIKPEVFKSHESLWQVQRDKNGNMQFVSIKPPVEKLALFGVRPCDLRALLIQDKVFLEQPQIDKHYQQRRQNMFIVVANCTRASNNCFCVSAGGYPQAKHSFDLAMTELSTGFVVELGSQRGQATLAGLNLTVATEKQCQQAIKKISQAATQQTKSLPQGNIRDQLFANLNHPHWDEVAARCLACGNCTQVCPTCFCHREHDQPALDGDSSTHVREWDSCFSRQHSYIHGKTIRPDTKSRYRQWLTHKLGSWQDQFDTSGCVGCGRCMTWCPVGIDITEETHLICANKDKT